MLLLLLKNNSAATQPEVGSYLNQGSGVQVYVPQVNLQTGYLNGTVGASSYTPTVVIQTTYQNQGSGTQTYASQVAGSYGYLNAGVGTQTYSPTVRLARSYSVTGATAMTYNKVVRIRSNYANTGASSQEYVASGTVPEVPKGDSFAIRFGNERHIHAPPERTPEEKPKKAKKTKATKVHKPDQNAIDRLKDAIAANVQIDATIEEGLAAARLLLEQERLEQLRRDDEEQAQIALVIALAQRRRSRFTRLSV